MSLTLSQVAFLLSPAGEALLAVPLPADPLAALTALRRHCTPDEASAVMKLRERRERAADKFPTDLAGRLLATDVRLQQASSLRTAIYKGRRLRSLRERLRSNAPLYDLCCGIGADAIGAALAGQEVRGWDMDAVAVACAAHNAAAAAVGERCCFAVGDVTQLELPQDACVHIDPDRRPAGRRTRTLADYQPPEAFLRALPTRTAAGAMKLSPAQDWRELVPAGTLPSGRDDVELEWLSEAGVCKQLVLWWGVEPTHARGQGVVRRATVLDGPLDDPQPGSLPAGEAPPAPVRSPGPWLIEPDPAVLAAEGVDDLAAALGLWRIEPSLAWLFGDAPADTPLARSYEVLRELPGRERDVARALRALDAGIVEVKARGVKLDTDALQRQLRGKSDRPLVVAWCRIGPRQTVFLCRRVH